MPYKIVRRKTDAGWQVEWDGEKVFEDKSGRAESTSHAFAQALEMGIVGSKEPLYANSRVEIKGWMDYLSAFGSYEEYKG